MKSFLKAAGLIFTLTAMVAALLLGGCGGGGGGGDSFDSGDGSASQTGTAALLLRDAPADEYDSIILCINRVTLEPGSEVFFEAEDGCVEVDLLDHKEKPFLLNVKDVPAGTYNQIRMTVDYIRTEGGACERLDIKLPSNVIKINPQGPFTVNSGDKVVIDVDVKAKQSVNIHVAGKSGKCIFRPVIIAEVKTIDDLWPEWRCPRILKGTITALKLDDNDDVTGFKIKLRHSKYDEVSVRVNSETVVFDEDGSFTDPNSLKVGQRVKVRGELLNDLSFLSSLVILGKSIDLHGTAQTEVVNGQFEMDLDRGQEVIGEIVVEIDNQTLILTDCKTEVDRDVIKPGTGVRAIGKLSGGNLIAVTLFLEEPANYGTIEAMQDIGSGYELEFTPANRIDSETIFLSYDAITKVEGDGHIRKDLLARLVNCDPRQAHIKLNEIDDGIADRVEVKQEVTGGKIKRNGLDEELERITLESGEVIQVQEYATIIKDGRTVSFRALEEGDVITVFGLEDCEGNKNGIDFYGFVIIEEDNL